MFPFRSLLGVAVTDLYADDASTPKQVWVENVYVTAISGGACVAGKACQIFVQDATYASLGLVTAHHAIRVLVSSTEAAGFADVVVERGWARFRFRATRK